MQACCRRPSSSAAILRLDDLLRACMTERRASSSPATSAAHGCALALLLRQTRAGTALLEYQDALIDRLTNREAAG